MTSYIPYAYLLLFIGGIAAIVIASRKGMHREILKTLRGGPASLEHAEQMRQQAAWLRNAAYLPEALSVALTVSWAWAAQDNAVIRWIFCAAFIGFVVFKAQSVPAAVNAGRGRDWGLFAVTSALALGSVLTLFGSSIFELVNNSGDEVQARIEASKPAQALDAELEAARQRLAGLAGYADASKADAEERAAQARAEQAQAELTQARAELAKWAQPDCTPKRDAKGQPYTSRAAEACAVVREIEARAGAGGSGYAARHADYLGLQSHLAGLLKQRAELSESGQGVQSAYRPEDRLLGAWFKVDPETAAWGKWILFALVFDLASLIARVAAQMLLNAAGGDPRRELRRKVDALLTLGIDPMQNLHAALAGAVSRPATEPVAEVPHYRYGGHVPNDGPGDLHKDEFVMPPEAVRLYGLERLEELRRAALGEYTPNVSPDVDAKRTPDVTPDVTPNDTASVTSNAPPSVNAQRVPPELAGKRGKGRQGLVDTCLHCGADYLVTTWTQTYCNTDCTAKAAGYTDNQARKDAWFKGKKIKI